VGSGGRILLSGGTTSNATVSSGATETVFSGGTASNTTILSGATLVMSSGGGDVGTTISAGGTLAIGSGVSRTGYTVGSGAFFVVQSGATASATSVSAGSETVSSGGTLASATISAGGLVEIKSGGTAGSSTITILSGTLKLDDSQHFSGSIAGLANSAQVVDLVDINFAALQTVAFSGASSSGGILTVSDGTHVAQLNLIGNYLAATFTSANDGAGGTLITDPPISSAPGVASPH
jgi:autotransporter passenger strand-loop-strand repeat protein